MPGPSAPAAPRRMRARARRSGRRRERRALSKRRRKNPAPASGPTPASLTHASLAHASRRRKRPNSFACCRNGSPDWTNARPKEFEMKHSRLPSREELVAFIRERSGKIGTREIARAFGAKNADRAALNRMLRELADEGQIDRLRKRLHHAGTLPPVVLADVTGRDADGELLARPTEWDEAAHGAPPVIRIVMPRRPRPGEVAGVGDRALLRIEKSGEDETAARVIKLLDRAKHRVLGIFRGLPGGGGRLVPVDKKQLGREMAIPADRALGAVDGDLVAVEVSRNGRLGLPMGSVIERLGSIKSERAISLIAIHSHDIPHVFARALLDEADAARPATLAGREDWRSVPFVTIDPPDAKDHDDAVHAVPDPDPHNAGGHLVTVAIEI